MQAATTAVKVKIVFLMCCRFLITFNGWSLHRLFYQFNKIILCAVPAKWQRRCRSTAFYPITSKCNRYCGKVFPEITKIHYASRLVYRISYLELRVGSCYFVEHKRADHYSQPPIIDII